MNTQMESLHNTTPTQFVEANGIRFAYRRFGKMGSELPLVQIQHFRGNLDNHDPALTDTFARTREVVLFDNAGIAASTGEAKTTIAAMAADAEAFIDALGLDRIDLFGFSMGGHVAQQIAVDRPDLVRRLVLVGTGPRGGQGMARLSDYATELFTKTYDPQALMWLPIFFGRSERAQAAGRMFLERIRARMDRDLPVTPEAAAAHSEAAGEWGLPGSDQSYLRSIMQPTLVVNGSDDVVIPTVNSYTLQQSIPNARLLLFPDSNHGSQFQFHDVFTREVIDFLSEADENSMPMSSMDSSVMDSMAMSGTPVHDQSAPEPAMSVMSMHESAMGGESMNGLQMPQSSMPGMTMPMHEPADQGMTDGER